MRIVKARLQENSLCAKQVVYEVLEFSVGHKANVVPITVIVRHHNVSVER